MNRHDIRLRRHELTSGSIQKHKDYNKVLKQYRKKSYLRNPFLIIVLIVLIAIALVVYLF